MLSSKSHVFCALKNELAVYSGILSKISSINNVQNKNFSSVDTATMRRGTGGRSSFSGLVTTVFGASGFLGKHVVNQLGRTGSQVILPYRGPTYDVKELRLMGDLGQIVYLPFNPESDDDIRKAIKYSNVVVNLIGKENETKNWPHEKVHVDLCSRIARICTEMGVEKLVHMSALNATVNPEPIITSKGSSFLRTKALGEIEVRREFPDAIIVRPSDMFGQNDNFLFYYARGDRRLMIPYVAYFISLWKQGKQTFKQPVYGADVAKAIMYAIKDPACKGLTVEATGPDRYRLDHLVWWIHLTLQFPIDKIHIIGNNFIFRAKNELYMKLRPTYPFICTSRYEREFYSDTLLNLPNLTDLGVPNPTKLEDRIYWELRFKRRLSYYWAGVNEFNMAMVPPKILTNDPETTTSA